LSGNDNIHNEAHYVVLQYVVNNIYLSICLFIYLFI